MYVNNPTGGYGAGGGGFKETNAKLKKGRTFMFDTRVKAEAFATKQGIPFSSIEQQGKVFKITG